MLAQLLHDNLQLRQQLQQRTSPGGSERRSPSPTPALPTRSDGARDSGPPVSPHSQAGGVPPVGALADLTAAITAALVPFIPPHQPPGSRVKASKCEFGRTELGFLGHRVSAAGVSVDPRKVAVVRDWPTPTSNAEVRRFVGLCNYYRRFVDGYAERAAPLTRLCGPHSPWQWGETEQASFATLKHCLTTAPVLRTFDPARRAVLWRVRRRFVHRSHRVRPAR